MKQGLVRRIGQPFHMIKIQCTYILTNKGSLHYSSCYFVAYLLLLCHKNLTFSLYLCKIIDGIFFFIEGFFHTFQHTFLYCCFHRSQLHIVCFELYFIAKMPRFTHLSISPPRCQYRRRDVNIAAAMSISPPRCQYRRRDVNIAAAMLLNRYLRCLIWAIEMFYTFCNTYYDVHFVIHIMMFTL